MFLKRTGEARLITGIYYIALPLKLEQQTGWLYGKASREDLSKLSLQIKLLLFSQNHSKISKHAWTIPVASSDSVHGSL